MGEPGVKIFITGIAGVLGSTLANYFRQRGYDVKGNDIVRTPWRLESLEGYIWKYSEDLTEEDIGNADIIFFASEKIADRPLGSMSPNAEITSLLALNRVAEIARRKNIPLIYPSSFNALYGNRGIINWDSPPRPTNFYGWAKASAELLIYTYNRQHKTRFYVTRVSSAYGPKMRFDEFIAQLMLHLMYNRPKVVRSPHAMRVWTYIYNVVEFYEKMVNDLPPNHRVYHLVGDKGPRLYGENMEIARQVFSVLGKSVELIEGETEAGEEDVYFSYDDDPYYQPVYTAEEGIKVTYEWFLEYCSTHELECRTAIEEGGTWSLKS